jgi:hypothetical protein
MRGVSGKPTRLIRGQGNEDLRAQRQVMFDLVMLLQRDEPRAALLVMDKMAGLETQIARAPEEDDELRNLRQQVDDGLARIRADCLSRVASS